MVVEIILGITLFPFSVFSLPPELMRKEKKVLVEISDDSDNEEEKVGFVQHLSATKRFQRNHFYCISLSDI